MSILKTIEKEKVKFLMDFDYNNVLGRLKFVLGKDASFFADIRVRQNDVTWSIKDNKEYCAFTDANDSEKRIIKEIVDGKIEKLSSIISEDSLIGPHTEKIIFFPSNQYIYYTVKDGVYNVILTGWGCDTTEPKEKDETPKQKQAPDKFCNTVVQVGNGRGHNYYVTESGTELQDRIRGSLIGGAIGDALGYPVEFMSLTSIKRKYGDEGYIDHQEFNKEGKAVISDDTQMTLFTANGLLFGITRYCTYDAILAGLESYVEYAYQDWLQTQDGVDDYYKYHYCWIRDIEELNGVRAPGNTCISALRHIRSGLKVENDSKGCGGVMRVAPVGLMAAADNDTKFRWKPWESAEVAKLGGDCAVITHKHPLGYLSAAFQADLIFHIMETEVPVTYSVLNSYLGSVYSDLQKVYTEDREQKALRELWSLIEKAVELAADWRVFEENAIRQLGEGWTGDEALAIAIYCTMRHIDDFWQAVAAAVNHDGDSDSTGAVCGNLMGAIVGYEAIPSRLTQNLELKALILEMADDLSKLCIIGAASQRAGSQKDADRWETKYIKNEPVIEERSWKNVFGMHKPYHILPQAQRAIEAKQLLEALDEDEELAVKCKKGYQLAMKVYDTETIKPYNTLPYWHLYKEPEFLDLRKDYLPAFYYGSEDPKYSPRNSNWVFKMNLLCFEGKNPVVAVRNDTLDQRNELRAGLVNYYEKSICDKYPGWEFYLLDSSTADGNYAVFTNQLEKEFAVEIAHLWEDGTLHRIYHLYY